MKHISILFLLLAFLTACEPLILGEDESNTPENNFELFWQDFDEHYGLFEARGWNWDSIYSVYRPQVTAETTDEELWAICREMIAYLDDSHTFIYNPENDDFFASGEEDYEAAEAEFSMGLILNEYLESYEAIAGGESPEDWYWYGKIEGKNIGYIYLEGMELEDTDVMDEVLAEIGQQEAMIIDIRGNFGGYDEVAAEIAGRFADGEHFIYTVQERNGAAHTDFSEKRAYYTQAVGEQSFRKPVVLLTDEITVSAAEIFGLHMKAFADVTQIGTPTSGDFSDTSMRRFLPNGWQYQYSIMMFLLPDGTSLDGTGHIPDIYIRNTEADIQAGNDLVLERAFQFLFDEYGIE